MKSVKCVNENGLSAVFTYDHDSTEYFLVSLDGVYSIKNTVNTSQNATTDGSSYSGEALQQRNIVIRYIRKAFSTTQRTEKHGK